MHAGVVVLLKYFNLNGQDPILVVNRPYAVCICTERPLMNI